MRNGCDEDETRYTICVSNADVVCFVGECTEIYVFGIDTLIADGGGGGISVKMACDVDGSMLSIVDAVVFHP